MGFVKGEGRVARGCLEISPQFRQERNGSSVLEVRVEVVPEFGGGDNAGYLAVNFGAHSNFRKHVHFQVRSEGVREFHVTGKGGEDEVPHLNAVGGDGVTESVVILAEEFGEIVEEHEQNPQRAFVQFREGACEFCISQERRQKFEKVSKKHGIHGPSLLLRNSEHAANEDTVAHYLKPGVRKAGALGGPQQVQGLRKGNQHRQVDGFNNRLWCIQLQKKHDEDAVVGELEKFQLARFNVMHHNSANKTKNLVEEIDFSVGVGRFARVFDKQSQQPNKRIDMLETFISVLGEVNSGNGSCRKLRSSAGLRRIEGGIVEGPVTYFSAVTYAVPEETSDEFICFQNTMEIHLFYKVSKSSGRSGSGSWRMIQLDPLTEQNLGLFLQASGIVEVPRLVHTRMEMYARGHWKVCGCLGIDGSSDGLGCISGLLSRGLGGHWGACYNVRGRANNRTSLRCSSGDLKIIIIIIIV